MSKHVERKQHKSNTSETAEKSFACHVETRSWLGFDLETFEECNKQKCKDRPLLRLQLQYCSPASSKHSIKVLLVAAKPGSYDMQSVLSFYGG